MTPQCIVKVDKQELLLLIMIVIIHYQIPFKTKSKNVQRSTYKLLLHGYVLKPVTFTLHM